MQKMILIAFLSASEHNANYGVYINTNQIDNKIHTQKIIKL